VAGTVTANLGTIADVSTETTLAAIKAKTDNITACNTGAVAGTVTANLGTIADVATETTLAAIKAKTDNITACNTGAIVGTVTANLGTIADVATETTLAAIKAKTDNITACNTGAVVLAAGSAEIGKLGAGTAEIGKLAAGSAAIGTVGVTAFASGKTIKRAAISAASSGNNTLVAAVADKKIKVLSVLLVGATAVTVAFQSGAGGTALTGVMSLGATAGFVLPPPADPNMFWFETGVNTLLNLSLGGAVQVSGVITYFEEA
jgi:hypothetical protein